MQTGKDVGKNSKEGILAVSKWREEGGRACLKHRGVFSPHWFSTPKWLTWLRYQQ